MNSPDPESPGYSSPSSGSRTPEEILPPQSSGLAGTSTLLSAVSSSLSGSAAAKRRMNFAGGGSNRDVKTRRRDDHRKGMHGSHGGGSEMWEGKGGHGGGKKDKDELVDHHLVEYIKKEIGDPFFEATFAVPR
ncbi:hypothetical protein AAF712_005835 [Marasmius tenuissimus]|uniref:Uncharacterized protein n=1 Tax=Marasmius tenuissimus TaxID=585030 RepID=A0ABR3A131_9AGAR